MNRRPVNSSRVASVGWEDGLMEVEFRSGEIYHYHEVPESTFQTLVGASSVGKHLEQVIDKHEHTKVK